MSQAHVLHTHTGLCYMAVLLTSSVSPVCVSHHETDDKSAYAIQGVSDIIITKTTHSTAYSNSVEDDCIGYINKQLLTALWLL